MRDEMCKNGKGGRSVRVGVGVVRGVVVVRGKGRFGGGG